MLFSLLGPVHSSVLYYNNNTYNIAKAGKISAMKLTPEERRARALKAVRAREEKRKLKTCNNSSDIL